MKEKLSVAVLGAGPMGHGIAQVFAEFGHVVTVYDPDGEALASVSRRIETNLCTMGKTAAPVLANVSTTSQLATAVGCADLVIEAAPESIEVKRKLFHDIASSAPAHAILTSNTSVIPITLIGENLSPGIRAHLVGTHWWNPPYLVPLVEVVRSEYTDLSVFEMIFELLLTIGKKPVRVHRDITGFVGNRLQNALWREALSLIESGLCDTETIDVVVKNSFGMRLPVLGPIENIDLIGLELTRDIHRILLPDLSCAKQPSKLPSERISEGKLGIKSGEGLRVWNSGTSDELQRRVSHHLLNMLNNG